MSKKIIISIVVIALLAGAVLYFGSGEGVQGFLKFGNNSKVSGEVLPLTMPVKSRIARKPSDGIPDAAQIDLDEISDSSSDSDSDAPSEPPSVDIDLSDDTDGTPPDVDIPYSPPSVSIDLSGDDSSVCGSSWEEIYQHDANGVITGSTANIESAVYYGCDLKVVALRVFPDSLDEPIDFDPDRTLMTSFECAESFWAKGLGNYYNSEVVDFSSNRFACIGSSITDPTESYFLTQPTSEWLGAHVSGQTFLYIMPEGDRTPFAQLYNTRYFGDDRGSGSYQNYGVHQTGIKIFARK